MKGLKNKILIAFLIIISLILGYQAYVMADNDECLLEITSKTKTPFITDNGYIVYCREHYNSFGFGSDEHGNKYTYKCVGDVTFNNENYPGMAYFMYQSQRDDYDKIAQNVIWGWSTTKTGETIIHAGNIAEKANDLDGTQVDETELEKLDEITLGNLKIENLVNDFDLGTDIDVVTALSDPTVYIVDEYHDIFFSEAENSIASQPKITYEEYCYLYQLLCLYDCMAELDSEGKLNVDELASYLERYQADENGTVYAKNVKYDANSSGLTYVDTDDNEVKIEISNAELNQTNSLGKTVDKFTCELEGKENIVLWAYSENKNDEGKYNILYYSDGTAYGTKKFAKCNQYEESNYTYGSLLWTEHGGFNYASLNEYIDLYNGDIDAYITLTGSFVMTEYGSLSAMFAALDNSDDKISENAANFFDIVKKIYDEAKKCIAESAGLEITNPLVLESTNNYKNWELDFGLLKNARIYDYIIKKDYISKWVNDFTIDNSNAKVSIENTDEQQSYIVGPFKMYYHTVKLGNDTLVGLEDDSFKVWLNNGEIDRDGYELICANTNNGIPAVGEDFYIKIDAKDNRLTKDSELKVGATYEYWGELTATVHFLHAVNPATGEIEGTDPDKYSKDHPQRLMTATADLTEKSKTVTATVTPDYHEFIIEKVDANNSDLKLEGAVFNILAEYKSGDNTTTYFDVETQSKKLSKDNNNLSEYKTNEYGQIKVSNLPTTIAIDETEYTLSGIIAKEIQAPDGYKITNSEWKEKKVDSNDKTITWEWKNEIDVSYELTLKKVDENGNAISGIKLKYWFLDLNKTMLEHDESDNGIGVDDYSTGETDENGILTIKGILGKNNGNGNDMIALVICEQPESAKDYQYFSSMLIVYTPVVNNNGKVEINYYTKGKNEKLDSIWEKGSYVKSEENVVNGVNRITLKDAKTHLYGEEATEYIKCGVSDDIDIQITNDSIKPYNLQLFKYNEDGEISPYLDGTKFNVVIAKDENTSYQTTVEIKDGKAEIENLDIFGEGISLYLVETPADGYETVLSDSNDKPVIIYNADESGKVEITYVNESLLNSVGKEIDGYQSADVIADTVNDIISLRLKITNANKPYAIKFKKVDDDGNPLSGATFTLAEPETDENGKHTTILGTDTSESNGYMTYTGLTKTGAVTLHLYEESAPEGYYSEATEDNPVIITYTYEAGNNKLTNIKATINGKEIEAKGELVKTEGTEIIFDFGEFNEIFNLINKPNPYDLELFTKVDEDGNPIPNIEFTVSVYSENDEGKTFAEYIEGNKTTKIEEITVKSNEEGKVIIPNVQDYGTFYVEVKENKDDNSEYKYLTDTLIFNYTIAKGETSVTWGDTLKVIEEGSEVAIKYTKTSSNSTNYQDDKGQNYNSVEIDGDVLLLINKKEPYSFEIDKIDGISGSGVSDVPFDVVITKNGTTEEPYKASGTTKNGKITVDDIGIYTKGDETITATITENVPEGYKYETIVCTIEYKKTSPSSEMTIVSTTVKAITIDGEEVVLKSGITIKKEATNNSHIIIIENMPVYDLKIFDKKVLRNSNGEESEIKNGISFTGVLKDSKGNTLQEAVEIEFNGNIVAKDIDTCSLFINEDGTIKDKVEGLELIVKEMPTNGITEIKPITVVFDCIYSESKFTPIITGFKYDNKTYSINDEIIGDLIDNLIYVKDGKTILVNIPKVAKLVIEKYDDKGNKVNGITFEGTISVDGSEIIENFKTTTGAEVNGEQIDGEAIIVSDEFLGKTITITIEKEYWDEDYKPEYSELEFMSNIIISGITIDENGNVDYSNASVDEQHKDKVTINANKTGIKVINNTLTYNIPIIKTTELLSDNEDATRLEDVYFNILIKPTGKEDSEALKTYTNVETDDDGMIILEGIDVFGDLTLVLEETVGSSKAQMLEDRVSINYTASKDDNGKVQLSFNTIDYEDTSDVDKVEIFTKQTSDATEEMEFIGINVVNPQDYSITLEKKMKVNGITQSISDEVVTFKGIITTDAELKINEKLVRELEYDDFKNIDFTQNNTENTIYFEETATSSKLAEISKLKFYDSNVYVYFIEELQENSSMTAIEDVMTISFVQGKKELVVGDANNEKVSVDDSDRLNIKVSVVNDASAYKLKFIKKDSTTNQPVKSLKNAKFKFILKEIVGDATITADEVIIDFNEQGKIDVNDTVFGDYIVGAELVDDYIQLDINKYGDLQLEIMEINAPKYYIRNDNVFVIPYVAQPGNIEIGHITGEGLETKTIDNGLEISLENTPDDYELPIYKVITDGTDNLKTNANNVKFDVRFYDSIGENSKQIMNNAIYTVVNGKFTVTNLTEYGEYYMTLEETDTPGDIVRLEGIHVFKIKATAEEIIDSNGNVVNDDVIKEIQYIGTANINNGKLKSVSNNDINKYGKYFETSEQIEGTAIEVARLEIKNKEVTQYKIDLLKYSKTTDNVLSDVLFSLYLTEVDKDYATGENLLDINNFIRTGTDGKIVIDSLKLIGEYKLTIIEEEPPKGMKQTFDKIEIIYSTADGENINISEVKVYKDGKEVSRENIVQCLGEKASLKIEINNEEKNKVPLKIYKKDKDTNNPLAGAVFSGTVKEIETGAEYTFSGITTNEYGYADLGEFPVDGEIEVTIREIIAPNGYETIPDTSIWVEVDNQTKTLKEGTLRKNTNAVEGANVDKNAFIIIEPEGTPVTIKLAGLVWKDVKQYSKGEETYTSGDGSYTEGLYDIGKDETVEGVVVKLYKKGFINPIARYTTGLDGTYVFEDLDPFAKYYITFEYNTDNTTDYEPVKYLVYDKGSLKTDDNGENYYDLASYGTIEEAIKDDESWAVNSKAIVNSDDNDVATIAKDDKGNVQYFPVYDYYTISNEEVILYWVNVDGKKVYKTQPEEGSEMITFEPIYDSHIHLNLGLIEKPPFDLSLTKDVEQIKATINGQSMTYLYGTKPQSSMYKLEISKANIDEIKNGNGNLEIIYKIAVTNENVADGKLISVADYYNSDLLELEGAYYDVVQPGEESSYSENKIDDKITETTQVKSIIPVQTYNDGTLDKNNLAITNRAKIAINQDISTGETIVIYVKYKYNIDKLVLEEIDDEYVTLGVAEIWDSQSKSGKDDIDSDSKNLISKFNELQNFYNDGGSRSYYTTLNDKIKEDDEDTAPAAKIVIGSEGSTISGNVFEDEDEDGVFDVEKDSDGKINKSTSETQIKGVTVNLYDDESTLISTTQTADDGSYTFTGLPAGQYYITFTYGDKNTVLPILQNEDGNDENADAVEYEDENYPRQNYKSYNALEYEDTIYEQPDSNNYYWYATTERKSDAKDIAEDRQKADSMLTTNSASPENGYGIMNNELAEKMYSYNADLETYKTAKDYVQLLTNYAVTAKTADFKINIENTADSEIQYRGEAENGTVIYGENIIANTSFANNIDFGIKARSQSNIEVSKEVKNVKIYSHQGVVSVDVTYKDGKPVGTNSRVQWNKNSQGNQGYIWIQRSEEEIVGATLEITYEITVKNEAGEDIVVTLADYIQDGMTYSVSKNEGNNWNMAKAETVTIDGKTTSILSLIDEAGKTIDKSSVLINNKIDLTAVSTVVTQDIELNEANKYNASMEITLTKTLNSYSETDIDEYTNYVEIIQTKSDGLAKKDIDSIPGNYDPINRKTSEGNIGIVTTLVNGLEKDSAKSLESISITAETGENKQTYYIITFAVIAVFATGVVLIKKKVLKK